jgi:fructose-specific PTS system IIA-like component
MACEHRFVFPLTNGLHARPASCLEAVASRFQAKALIVNVRNQTEADAKSVLSLVAADIHEGDECVLRLEGADAEEAFKELTRFLGEDFLHCDEALPEVVAPAVDRPLPRALRAAGISVYQHGTVVCRGLAQARVVRVGGLSLARNFVMPVAGAADEELKKFGDAVAALRADFEREIVTAKDNRQIEVLKAHAAILRDVSLAARVEALLKEKKRTAGDAVIAAVEEFAVTLRKAGSAYLRERVLDLQDVSGRLLTQLYGKAAVTLTPVLTAPSIVVAESLTPGQFLALDRGHLRGLVLAHAGVTSHTVILARSFGVPTLTGVGKIERFTDGQEVVLDGRRGLLIAELESAGRRYYAMEMRKLERLRQVEAIYRDRPGASRDGRRLPIMANVASASEVAAVIEAGAEGVGLFRTEMLYMDRDEAPSEEEQYAIYADAARAAAGRPVIIRTIDIGGDKPVPYLQLPEEANPFLGVRGVRLYAGFSVLVRTQLRAILRASRHGALKVMVPMIASPEEMRGFRALVDEVRAELRAAGEPDGAGVSVGMMLEVPSAVLALAELAAVADFFSIGTNDLAQYFFAADRDNPRVSGLQAWTNPAFLRFLKFAIDGAHAAGRPIGLCGEMGEQADAQLLLLGIGIDSLSMGAPRILAAKAGLARCSEGECKELADASLAGADRAAVEKQIREFRSAGAAMSLISGAVISLDSEASSKAEVIKELTDALALDDRTTDAAAVEEAVWAREETYSTGFGYGFAVPHCKSAHVTANTIAVVRMRAGIEWGSLDGAQVKVAILLAIREADQGKEHMRIFSRLSRLVMNDDFRAAIEQATAAGEVLDLLTEKLGLAAQPVRA